MQQGLQYCWQEKTVSQEIIHCTFTQMLPHHTLPLRIVHELYENGVDTGSHWHDDFYAFYVVQSGKGIHVINSHPYAVTRGDVYILSPGSVHAYHDYHDLSIDAFYFQPRLFSRDELAALQSLSGFWRLLLPTEHLFGEPHMNDSAHIQHLHDYRLHVSPERHHIVEGMVAEICTEFTVQSHEATLLTRSQFFRMLVHVARWHTAQPISYTDTSETSPLSNVPHSIGLAKILQLCEERFSEPLTVPQLAALLFLSPSRFTELFSHEVGVSPAAYIRRLRLERAQTLLRTTSLSVTTIAHQVGFRDMAQFSRAFHIVFHLTPTAYRATFR